MRISARDHAHFGTLKIKADADKALASARAVREGAPTSRLVVDGNESWSIAVLERLLPELQELGVRGHRTAAAAFR